MKTNRTSTTQQMYIYSEYTGNVPEKKCIVKRLLLSKYHTQFESSLNEHIIKRKITHLVTVRIW